MAVDQLCDIDDVRAQASSKVAEIMTEDKVQLMIHAAQAEVYAHITPHYKSVCPFSAPVPPILRWDCARMAYGMLISGQVGPSEPNKTDYGEGIIKSVKEDLMKIVMCEKGLYDIDGNVIERETPCPEGSPNSNASSDDVIMSNTGLESKGNITIFSLEDVPER